MIFTAELITTTGRTNIKNRKLTTQQALDYLRTKSDDQPPVSTHDLKSSFILNQHQPSMITQRDINGDYVRAFSFSHFLSNFDIELWVIHGDDFNDVAAPVSEEKQKLIDKLSTNTEKVRNNDIV